MFKVVCSVDSSWHVVNSGGNANNTTNDGAFYLNANNVLANVNRNISRRLCLFKMFLNKSTQPHR
jgi:hypothetical protein